MSKKVKVEWVVPTIKSDLKELQNAFTEASNSKLRIEAEQDQIKCIYEEVNEKFGMPKKKFNEWLKIYHKQNYADTVANLEEVTTEYAEVMSGVDKTL